MTAKEKYFMDKIKHYLTLSLQIVNYSAYARARARAHTRTLICAYYWSKLFYIFVNIFGYIVIVQSLQNDSTPGRMNSLYEV